jgi:type II secretory ATPase GspE/PulE/Tfp pilus assembly ATPase PilB-like protein
LPVYDGEKIVMRLLHEGAKPLNLEQLGFLPKQKIILEDAIKKPHGMILVTGPTGSGKTTTLYSILGILNQPGVNISTVEDPIEYRISGVNQSQINPKVGFTFATGLRSLLRQDPNIIMVGEIRDQETADLAVNAALTGHLVFSTLHTNDASGVPPRLLDMGVEPFLLTSSLNCVVGQRVLRRVCKNCVGEMEITPDKLEELKTTLGPIYDMIEDKYKKEGKKMTLPKIVGCDKCNNTGYLGRVAIYEVMPVSEKISKMVISKASASDIQKLAMEEGMLSMKQDGYVKALEGVTTMDEVIRVAQY